MGRAGAGTTQGLLCPDCATELEPAATGTPGMVRLSCPGCGGKFRVSRTAAPIERPGVELQPLAAPTVGPITLRWRSMVLRVIEHLYWSVTIAGSILLFVLGGFVPVLRGWLGNEIEGWGDVVAALGGVWFRVETTNPDSDLGPVLARVDAPLLFSAIDSVSRRLGIRPPGQVRLTYLPCCGVVAWGRSRALLIGLPLLRVLTQGELRAVLAHELAHLARGDATRAARSARFVEGLRLAVDQAGRRAWGLLGAWARFCRHEATWLIEPVARGQETRADRLSAIVAGGGVAASALVKVALVQPLFREVLEHYDPNRADAPNLYAFFRAFWYRLPAESHSAMRLRVLTSHHGTHDPAHPPLPDRLSQLQAYPDPVCLNGDANPATTLLGDLEIFEQMLHNRLFGLPPVEPTIFHRAGS
jgi:Zn-dependent protease with chaperone function